MNSRYKISFCLHVSRAAKTHMMLIFLNAVSAQHFFLKTMIIEMGKKGI